MEKLKLSNQIQFNHIYIKDINITIYKSDNIIKIFKENNSIVLLLKDYMYNTNQHITKIFDYFFNKKPKINIDGIDYIVDIWFYKNQTIRKELNNRLNIIHEDENYYIFNLLKIDNQNITKEYDGYLNRLNKNKIRYLNKLLNDIIIIRCLKICKIRKNNITLNTNSRYTIDLLKENGIL